MTGFLILTSAFAADALAEQREAVAQKTVIDRKEIESLGGLTVGEVIRNPPGASTGSTSAPSVPPCRAK